MSRLFTQLQRDFSGIKDKTKAFSTSFVKMSMFSEVWSYQYQVIKDYINACSLNLKIPHAKKLYKFDEVTNQFNLWKYEHFATTTFDFEFMPLVSFENSNSQALVKNLPYLNENK